jgi:hypothetical protein
LRQQASIGQLHKAADAGTDNFDNAFGGRLAPDWLGCFLFSGFANGIVY